MNPHHSLQMSALLLLAACTGPANATEAGSETSQLPAPLDLPDAEIVQAYQRAAGQNVLAAVNDKVFFGYWSVCADGQGFGYGNSYPSLDGHQMADALLRLGRLETVKANWDYVRSFQKPNGQLPLAILPGMAGKKLGATPVDASGGFYNHWVPGNPLLALSSPTYIQNADVLFRYTQDRTWLAAQLASVNRAADFLAELTSPQGAVRGAGYYVERPTRAEYDGVAQCHAADAFRRIAALNRCAGNARAALRYQQLAARVAAHFQTKFWVGDHFAEYIHPQRGVIARHGLTDVDWSAIALDAATARQREVLWPQLKDEKRFEYGGVPTGIATRPETYEAWEFHHPDRHDLAAMGRVWYLECQARARMGDGKGLLESMRKVCKVGRESGYYWRERYHPDPKGVCRPAGAEKYCEYPANLIRVVQRFLLGVEFRLDGALELAPTAPPELWDAGFGQTLCWRGQTLSYRCDRKGVTGEYRGKSAQRLCVKLAQPTETAAVQVEIDSHAAKPAVQDGFLLVDLPAAPEKPCRFAVRQGP